ncbi:MAG: hypothetical protein VYC34_02705 [Planctomycetota bacterium]|nr:hypothetical protein [Planctomycetota bacterium]
MFFLLAYAIAIWSICYVHRRRWPAFVAPIASLAPIGFLTHLDLLFLFGKGESSWLMIFSGAFMGLILLVGFVIAVQPRTSTVEEPCPSCRYEMKGTATRICPECGADIDADKPRKTRRIHDPAPPSRAPDVSLATRLSSTSDERRARSEASSQFRSVTTAAPANATSATKSQ